MRLTKTRSLCIGRSRQAGNEPASRCAPLDLLDALPAALNETRRDAFTLFLRSWAYE